jgi:UDP-N-acetyl-alpha-D-muramoyl-L-alanyl-L-glutamate epimerase
MQSYKQFIFESYRFDPKTGVLELKYSMDGQLQFLEAYRFDFRYADYDEAVLDRALQALFFMAGVSYYKTFIPPEIVIKAGRLDPEQASFFSKTYQRGLGEFWYVNQLDPHTPVVFPATSHGVEPLTDTRENKGLLVAVGGGKDSLVSIEILKKHNDITTWSLNHRPQLEPLVKRIDLAHAWIEREWDTQLLELNKQGALNGHIPISGIFACVGVIVAILTGKRDVVMSNEQSANEPTLHYQDVAINHQYSKSQEFEQDFQNYLYHTLDERIHYYSFLRPLSEVRIAEIFARIGFDKYKDTFSSCNRAFVHTSDHISWCGECSKCAFVFMALTPFVAREKLEALWGGKNLLLNPKLEPTYRKLLGIEGDKPLDCVGDIKESREAMHLAFKQYPELIDKYRFDLPENYDYRTIGSHEMPPEIFEQLTQSIAALQLQPHGEQRE